MSVQKAAAGALHGLCHIEVPDQQGLHFAQFQRAQHATQSGDPASVAASLADGFANYFAASFLLPRGEDLFGLRSDFIPAYMRDFCGEPAQ